MKQIFTILTLFLTTLNLFGQTVYTGYIDKYPIELTTYIFSDGDARAIYAYSNYDTPMIVNGRLEKNKLTLCEKDKNENNKAKLIFKNFDKNNGQINGVWKDLKSNRQLKIKLTKKFELNFGENIEYKNREILQPVSLENKYFKLIVSKEKGEFYPKVTGLKIIEKKTDKLTQKFELDCKLMGLENISIGDYNFDGIIDFSVFERSYAGPNTSSLYFLFDPETGKFFKSSFEGVSLDFDQKKKRIYEHNQCCGGRSHMNAIYKVVNNKMVLIERTCIEYDKKAQEYKEVKCE